MVYHADEALIVSQPLANALQRIQPRSSDLRPLRIKVDQVGGLENIQLFAWQFTGDRCDRMAQLVGGPDVCPVCGFGPINCPDCGPFVNNPCPKCKSSIFRRTDSPDADPKKHIVFENDLQRDDFVLDGSRWDGSDCIPAGRHKVISWRLHDWLLKRHAKPFISKPVPFCTDNMSEQQWKWLEEIQKPFM